MFDKAVQVAKEITNDDDTLLVVTADHSHAFMMAGYPSRGNDILGLLKRFVQFSSADFQDFYVL